MDERPPVPLTYRLWRAAVLAGSVVALLLVWSWWGPDAVALAQRWLAVADAWRTSTVPW